MEKEADSPANLFRDIGRAWARERDKKQRIADLHAATEAFRALLEGEKGLVHRASQTIAYIEKEMAALAELEQLEHVDSAHHWISQDKLVLARTHACERAVSSAVHGRVFLAGWRDHFSKVVPEMAHRFPHANNLEQFFTHVEQIFNKKRDEYQNGHSFTQAPSLGPGQEQLAAIEKSFQDILDRLHTVEHDLAVLEHDTKNTSLQSMIFDELRKLAPLVYVTVRHGD